MLATSTMPIEAPAKSRATWWWARPANALVHGAYYAGILSAAMFLIAEFYPNPQHDQIGVALMFAAFRPYVGLYAFGLLVGLFRRSGLPHMIAVWAAAISFALVTPGFTGDVVDLVLVWATLLIAAFTVISGYALNIEFGPRKKRRKWPKSAPG